MWIVTRLLIELTQKVQCFHFFSFRFVSLFPFLAAEQNKRRQFEVSAQNEHGDSTKDRAINIHVCGRCKYATK